jgi:hypothetical protein
MKRVMGLLAVAAGVAAVCGTHQSFARPSAATGQTWCVGRDGSALETTFKYTSSLCWKDVGPGKNANQRLYSQYNTLDLVLPVLYIGGKSGAPGNTYGDNVDAFGFPNSEPNWQSNHCPASALVRTFLTANYNPATHSDNRERNRVVNNFTGSFQVVTFGNGTTTGPKNAGDCCVQNGQQYTGLSRSRRPSNAPSPLCP